MIKKFNYLLILLLVFTLFSCADNESGNTSPSGDDNDITSLFHVPGLLDENNFVSSLQIIDVPTEEIEIGYFSNANIKLEATYIDGTKAYKTITEEFFGESDLEKLKTPGKKHFEFVYKNNHMSLDITLKKPENPARFRVEFKDKDGNVLESSMINYLDEAKYSGPTTKLGYYSKGKYYRFDGKWDKNLKHIYQNISTMPLFTECELETFFDEYQERTTYFGLNYDTIQTLNKSTYDESLIYIGRMYNVSLLDLGEIYRDDYKNIALEYQRESFTRLEFVEKISENLKISIMHDNYYHDSFDNNYPRCYLVNSSLLNFNLSLNTDLEDDELGLYQISSCFLRAPSDQGFSGLSFERYDGIQTSFKSIFNHLEKEPYDLYNQNGSNILKLTEDYPLGYYKYVLAADLDIYLDIEYTTYESGGAENYLLKNAKICLCYDNLRFNSYYKKNLSDSYNLHHNKLTIVDRMVAEAIYFSE